MNKKQQKKKQKNIIKTCDQNKPLNKIIKTKNPTITFKEFKGKENKTKRALNYIRVHI